MHSKNGDMCVCVTAQQNITAETLSSFSVDGSIPIFFFFCTTIYFFFFYLLLSPTLRCCCCCCAVHRAAQMSRLFSLSLLSIIYVRFHTRSYLYTDGWWIVCCPTTEWLLGSSSRHCCRYSENLGFSHIFYTELCAVSAVFRKAILCCLMANKSEKRKEERTRHSVALCIAAMSNDLYTQERFKTITSGLPTAAI